MPNHIQNRLEVRGENAKKVFDFIAGKESKFDFNKIIPMPESLNITSGSFGEYGQHILFGKSDITWLGDAEIRRRVARLPEDEQKEVYELGKKYQANLVRYGHTTWYNWSIENWGTKWNAYQSPDERDTESTIYFQTAWSGVPDLIIKLSEKFPDAEIVYDWADENTGYNVGQYRIKNGEVWQREIENGSRAAYELAFELHPDSGEFYKLVGDNYQYDEEAEEAYYA